MKKAGKQTTVKTALHKHNSRFLALKAAIQEGMNSGVSNKTVSDIMEEIEARLGVDGRL